MNRHETNLLYNPKVLVVLRLILGISFIIASIHKIADPSAFAHIIYGYGLFPNDLINLIAIAVPFLELICGVLLVIGVYQGGASLILNIMLLGFILAISTNLIRGYDFDCGCFTSSAAGESSDPVSLLLRDFLFLGMGLIVLMADIRRKTSTFFSLDTP